MNKPKFEKFENFVLDLIDLCKKYEVILAQSEQGIIQVWDDDPEDPNYYFDFQNRLNHE